MPAASVDEFISAYPAQTHTRLCESKGTVRFPLDKSVPENLVRKLVGATLAEKRPTTE